MLKNNGKAVQRAHRSQTFRHVQPPSAACDGGLAGVSAGPGGRDWVYGAVQAADDDRSWGVCSLHQTYHERNIERGGENNYSFEGNTENIVRGGVFNDAFEDIFAWAFGEGGAYEVLHELHT